MNRNTSLRAAALITLFLLVINIGLALRNTRELQINTGWVEHTHKVISHLEAALAEVTEAETGVRGFLISGDQAHLSEVEPSLSKISDNITEVERLTADSPEQQGQIPELRRRIEARVAILRKLVEMRKVESLEAVRSAMAGYRGKDEMDALRAVAVNMINHERGNLEARRNQAEQTYRVALVAGLSSGLLGLFAIIGGFWLVRRQLRERELAESAVADTAERLRTTLASIGDGVITTDRDGLVTNLNAVAEHLTGWTTNEALGKPLEEVFKIVNESSREPVENPANRALSEGVIVGLANHTVLIAKDGSERPIDDSAAPIRSDKGEIVGCVLVFHDVSDRRAAERTLEKSERDLRDLFDNATIGIHWVGPDGTILRANQNELDMLGYTAEEFVGHNIAEFHADEHAIANILTALSAGESLYEHHARLIAKDGSIKTVIINSNTFREDGEFIHSRCFTRDVTEFEVAQAAQSRLAAIVETSEDAIISKKLDGTITTWNEGAVRLFGYTPEQAIGQHVSILIPPDRLSEETEIIARLSRGERIEHYDTIRHRRDGSPVEVSLAISPIRDAAGNIVGASKFARDVTQRKAAERSLRESEERLRLALEAGKMGTWEWRIPENQIFWSPGLERIHGLRPGSFDGTFESYKNDIHPEDRDRVLEAMNETLSKGHDHHVEYRLLLSDETIRWVEGRGKLFYDDAGRPTRMIGVCTDISERRRAETLLRENEEQLIRNGEVFKRLVEQSPFGIYTVDSQFRLHQVSVGAQAAFKNVRPLLGRDFAEAMKIIWPEDLAGDLIKTFRHTLETGESYLAPSLTAPRGDTDEVESYEWQIHRVTLPDGQYGVVCYYYDSTVLRQTEDELRMVAANLSEADRRKNEFLAMLAHELRNPLAPIRNALQIIRVSGPDGVPPATEMMERQVNQLVRLVDDLLDISRINSGKIELRKGKIELASFVNHAVEAARPSCEAGGVELRVSLPADPIYLDGDPIRLAQVVGNLLNNACKFTDRDGVIDLIVKREGSNATIVVRDNGIGIEPDEIKYIFDMFVQADTSLKRSSSGLGIGLTLVKNLVEMHGGTVEAKSAGLGHGTEFFVRIPLISEPESLPTAPSKKLDGNSNLPSRRILVVDDNVDSASSLEMLLKIYGHDVRMAHDGLEAVDSAEEFSPEVILLDIGLPKLNGYEAARRIKQASWGKNMILIALTGWGQEEDRQRSKEAGFDRHMVKPIEHDELMKLLEELVP